MAVAVSLVLLLLVGVHGTTIISIKYPQQQTTRQVKRDLSLSYAATNIDSKEGTRVKTITVIKNLGGVGTSSAEAIGIPPPSSPNSNKKQQKLAINPALHQNPEWASAFRDNFDSYGSLPDVPDIDDLFEFVNRKKTATSSSGGSTSTSSVEESEEEQQKKKKVEDTKPETAKEEITTKPPAATVASAAEPETDPVDSDEAIVEKIKGDAELLPHIKQVNILRLQAQQLAAAPQRTRESLINVNYSTPMHQVTQYFDNYVQALPNGYDYTKPCGPGPSSGNSIQVTTPSGRTYDIPQSNSSGTGGGNHPYLAPSLTKKTQIQPPSPPSPAPVLPPNYSSVNSIVPALSPSSNQLPQPVPPQYPPAPVPVPVPAGAAAVGAGIGVGVGGIGGGVSTSQRPYVAPRLRNNGLGINRGPPTPQPPLPAAPPQQPQQQGPIFGLASNRPNTLRSRGLKY